MFRLLPITDHNKNKLSAEINFDLVFSPPQKFVKHAAPRGRLVCPCSGAVPVAGNFSRSGTKLPYAVLV
jgi:hypothetical protein